MEQNKDISNKRFYIFTLIIICFGLGWCYRATNELLGDNGPFDYQEDSLVFDTKIWKETILSSYEENPRHYMLDDLRNNYLKIGMDTNELKYILGNPDGEWAFSYKLGFYISPFDPSILYFKIDSLGKITSFSVETN